MSRQQCEVWRTDIEAEGWFGATDYMEIAQSKDLGGMNVV
jgi:hypothetical protein